MLKYNKIERGFESWAEEVIGFSKLDNIEDILKALSPWQLDRFFQIIIEKINKSNGKNIIDSSPVKDSVKDNVIDEKYFKDMSKFKSGNTDRLAYAVAAKGTLKDIINFLKYFPSTDVNVFILQLRQRFNYKDLEAAVPFGLEKTPLLPYIEEVALREKSAILCLAVAKEKQTDIEELEKVVLDAKSPDLSAAFVANVKDCNAAAHQEIVLGNIEEKCANKSILSDSKKYSLDWPDYNNVLKLLENPNVDRNFILKIINDQSKKGMIISGLTQYAKHASPAEIKHIFNRLQKLGGKYSDYTNTFFQEVPFAATIIPEKALKGGFGYSDECHEKIVDSLISAGCDPKKIERLVLKYVPRSAYHIYARIPGIDSEKLLNKLMPFPDYDALIKFAQAKEIYMKKIEKFLLDSGNAYGCYEFARVFKGADIEALQKVVMSSNDMKLIKKFMEIEGADVLLLRQSVAQIKSTKQYSRALQIGLYGHEGRVLTAKEREEDTKRRAKIRHEEKVNDLKDKLDILNKQEQALELKQAARRARKQKLKEEQEQEQLRRQEQPEKEQSEL